MKKILAVLLCLAVMLAFAGCGAKNGSGDISSAVPEYTAADINIAGIKGPTAVGMVALMEKAEAKAAANNYNFSVYSDPQELVGKIATGAVDIAALPTNLASALYKKTNGGIKILAVNTYGVLSILENGETVSSVADLKGKTVYSTGEGSNPEYILRFILTENGLDPDKDLTLKFLGTNDELTAQIVAGNALVAMVPEPAATAVMAKVPTVRRVISMDTEWENVAPESALMMGCVVVTEKFLTAHPEAVKKFCEEYKASVDAVGDTAATAKLCEKFEIIPSEKLAAAAIPNCHIGYCAGAEMKEKLSGYFKVLFDADPTAVGGALPDDNFYYVQ